MWYEILLGWLGGRWSCETTAQKSDRPCGGGLAIALGPWSPKTNKQTPEPEGHDVTMFAGCIYLIACLQTARGTSGNIMHVCVDVCSGLSMRARAPGPQTLLARLPSRLSYRTDSTHLLIRNRHLASDPPRLPKDAPEWSFVQRPCLPGSQISTSRPHI